MSRRSLHLGLNSLDRDHYRIPDDVDGVLRTLHAAEHDAVSLHQLMESTWDFDAHVLLGQQVTAARLTAHVAAVAAESTAGDTFLLSFSGHGVQWSKSPDPDETDGYDESWALYDRLFFDDEIFDMCRAFPAGVRIVLVADSCHSQTSFSIIEDPRYRTGRARGLSREAAELTIEGNLAEYDRVRQNMNRTRLKDLSADAVLLAACLDEQLAFEGDDNGRFTGAILELLDTRPYQGSYRDLTAEAGSRIEGQTPQVFYLPGSDLPFANVLG